MIGARRIAQTLPVALLIALLAAPSGAFAAPVLTIGVGVPLSGPDAIFGDQVVLGVKEALADTKGAFLGATPEIARGDDAGDPKKGADVARGFVRAHVPIVIGHVSSAVTVPASAIYAEANILDITPSALAPLVTDRGLPMIFRTCGRDDQQAAVAARYLAGHFKRIALVHDRTATGKALADTVRSKLGADRIREVFYGSLETGTRDYPGLVSRLKASNAQVVFFGGTQNEAGLLLRQLREAGARTVLMGADEIASDEFATQAGAAAEGTLMVFPRDPRTRPDAAALLKRLQARGIEPDGTVFYAYAAIQVLAQAVAQAASLEPAKIAAALHSGTSFKTVLGPIAFDAKGDPTATDLTVYVWRKGPAGRMVFDEQADG